MFVDWKYVFSLIYFSLRVFIVQRQSSGFFMGHPVCFMQYYGLIMALAWVKNEQKTRYDWWNKNCNKLSMMATTWHSFYQNTVYRHKLNSNYNVYKSPVMGKSKSCFDLNHDWIICEDMIWLQEDFRWKHVIWFEFDLNWPWFDLTAESHTHLSVNQSTKQCAKILADNPTCERFVPFSNICDTWFVIWRCDLFV